MATAKPDTDDEDEDEDDAPGWHAIDAACEALYPRQKNPPHFAPYLSPIFGGGGLNGLSAYKADGPPRHWHFVTYGLSELYDKESDDPKVSGFGIELTFRLKRGAKESQPPNWAVNFLFNLGKYVTGTGNVFDAGHHMDLNGPIALDTDTAIHAIAFVRDPELKTIRTPNGTVQFVQAVGLTLDEYHACGDWRTAKVMRLLKKESPLLVTDLERVSMLSDPKLAKAVERGIDREGSLSESSFVGRADWKLLKSGYKVTLGAKAVQGFVRQLRARLAHGRGHTLLGPKQAVEFTAGSRAKVKAKGEVLTLTLTPSAVAALRAALQPVRGKYEWPELPGVVVEVVPSEITDADGKVVEVIG